MKLSFVKKKFRVHELVEKARENSLSDAERDELNTLLESDPQLIDSLAGSLFIDATLRHDTRLVRDLQGSRITLPAMASRRRWIPLMFAAAACGMLGLLLFQNFQNTPESRGTSPLPIATLVKSTGCKWASSTLPTVEGSRVTSGTYQLVEGLATLRFDSGAEVVLEAPATLELIDEMNCRLVSGTLVSDVPPSALGFTVDTPKARVVDFGTRFGVSTGADGKYMVQVLSGKIEVNDHTESKLHKLNTGQSIYRGLYAMKDSPQVSSTEPSLWKPDVIINDSEGWQMISTAYGRGKDSFIDCFSDATNNGRQALFYVKRSTVVMNYTRKGYLGFDIAGFHGKGFEQAELILSIEPSGIGFATLVPDSTFQVYGLTDESGDLWDESTMVTVDSPAHDPTSKDLHLPVPEKSALLGSFEISQGVSRGNCKLGGAALVDFLNADTNGIVTFIICRQTTETARGGLVHAFATKENGSTTPPLLRLKPKR